MSSFEAQIEKSRKEVAQAQSKITELSGKIETARTKMAQGTDITLPNTRSTLETQLATVNSRYNELVQLEQVKLGGSMATQMVLLNKLQTDTKQRVVLYDALSKSLKTAQQQDVAHQINEIGVATDKEAQVAMAAIGAATNTRMAEMMESHEDHVVFARKVLEEKVKADERFARRFEKIVEMHDKNAYGQGNG